SVRGLEPKLEGVRQVEEQRFLAAIGEAEAHFDKLVPVGRRNLPLCITDNLEVHIRHANSVRQDLLSSLDLRWVTLGRRRLLDWLHSRIRMDPLLGPGLGLEFRRALGFRRLQEQAQAVTVQLVDSLEDQSASGRLINPLRLFQGINAEIACQHSLARFEDERCLSEGEGGVLVDIFWREDLPSLLVTGETPGALKLLQLLLDSIIPGEDLELHLVRRGLADPKCSFTLLGSVIAVLDGQAVLPFLQRGEGP